MNVEPYRFFIDENETKETQNELDEIINLLAKLPDQQRIKIINRISTPLESKT